MMWFYYLGLLYVVMSLLCLVMPLKEKIKEKL